MTRAGLRRAVIGGALVLAGASLLLVTTGVVSLGSLVVPILLIVAGIHFTRRSFIPEARDGNVIAATLSLLTGLLLVVRASALPASDLASIWPLFMSVGGLSLVVYGLRKGGGYRITWGIPGAAIVLLSGLFLLFSTGVVERSLAEIAVVWWPLLLVGLGLLMLWSASLRRSDLPDDDAQELDDEAEID